MNKKFNFTKISVLAFLLSPVLAYAQFDSLGSLVDNFTNKVVSSVGTLFLALGVVVFFWGIVQFIWAKREGNASKTQEGQSFMVWGLIAIFVMFSIWGIVIFAQNTLGIQGSTITVPKLNFTPTSGTGGSNPLIGSTNPATGGAVGSTNPATVGTSPTCTTGTTLNIVTMTCDSNTGSPTTGNVNASATVTSGGTCGSNADCVSGVCNITDFINVIGTCQ